MPIKNKLMAAVALAAMSISSTAAMAADVEFQTWTFTEETGRAAIERLVTTFEEKTSLKVEPQGYAWGEMTRNYMLRAGSGTLPDVGQVQGRLLPMLKGIDGILDFNEVLGREKLESMFEPALLVLGQVDGRQIGLPWIGGTVGWVANTEVLEAAGVTEVPVTLEAFREALVSVRDNVPGSVPFGFATKNNNSIVLDYIIWVRTFGGDIISADGEATANSPEAVAALTWLVEAMKDRLIAPEIDRPDARRLFGQGATAFFIDAPIARTFARQFSGRDTGIDEAVKPIRGPVMAEGGTPVSLQWGHVLAAFGAENADENSPAVQFILHTLLDEQLVDYAVGQSTLPSTRTGVASSAVTSDAYLSEWLAASVEPTPHTIAGLENGAEVTVIVGEELQAAVLGQKSPQQAADDMQSRLEAAMASSN
jgi:multiple sugar transport system substrate-binding protein